MFNMNCNMTSILLMLSPDLTQVSAGCLVHVQEVKDVIIEWGWCPVAGILVQDGPEKGLTGWVRCSGLDDLDRLKL